MAFTAGAQTAGAALSDTSEIKTIRPSKEKEKQIFSDPKLSYKKDIVAKKGMFERLLEWLAEKLFGKAGYDNISTARSIIIWTIVVLSVGIIIWLLSRSELVSLIKPKAKATSFNFTDVTEDLDSINFDQKISDAVKTGDYRLAIRWHYLKTLYIFDKRELITFAPFKTNIDYGNELKGGNDHKDFVKLSRIYDYVWYGQFNLNEANYNNNAREFETVINKINV
ncbi:MAG: hypothetical protein H0W61_03965 [Bacteroidetes bacterium]|nr:hypothetical protein [Bacteroidota bacterium]